MKRIPRAKEAAEAILAEFNDQRLLPGQQLTYQQFLHRLPEPLRNGTDIDAGIERLILHEYVSQIRPKGPVVLTVEGFSAISGLSTRKQEENVAEKRTASVDEIDFVAIFALEKELQAFLRHLTEYQTEERHDITFYRAEVLFSDQESYKLIVLGLPQMGNYEAATATTRAIDVWNPRFVLLGGIAGGVENPGVSLGDVIVADLVVAYEPAKQLSEGAKRRPKLLRPAEDLVKAALRLQPRDWALDAKVPRPDGQSNRVIPRVHFGTVLSGEKVIADSEWMEQLARELDSASPGSAARIAAVEMEAYGTALASYRAPMAPGMFMAKSFCDWADASKNDAWQEYAADVSASFLTALLRSKPVETLKTHKPQAQRIDAKPYSGRSKLGLCGRMGDNWEDLADYYDVPLSDRKKFRQGKECQDLWEWLENRRKLGSLPEALETIKRGDLVDELIPANTET